ncbi:hypothetical protein [Gordonia alkanivorans]|uniref:hypothetical protein n=1 Tax=Gordonia alkanivorans TaxID=84096 RepID=UPI0004BCDD80|nr:hypothetical protein [Gordonia alkanivorans]
MTATTDFRSRYGAWETNGLIDSEAEIAQVDYDRPHRLSDRAVVKIIRLRLISDPGHPSWDVSYCWGEQTDGTRVPVQLDEMRLPKNNLSRSLVDMAKRNGRYAKGLGLLDAISFCQ